MSLLNNFIAVNKRVAETITPNHVHEANVFGMYRKLGTILMSHPRLSTVVDVGAGRSWQFPSYYKEWFNIRLIGLDIDQSEMADNELLDDMIECDVVSHIPLEPGSVDLFMIHSGIEHFQDNELALRNLFQALRPGGFILAQFPNRFAPFAIANRLLPQKAARWLLNKFMGPTTELGFTAYYDRTNYSSFHKICKRVGFNDIYYSPGFFSSSYYGFFLPLFACSYAFDMLSFALGIKNLASYNLWILQRPGDSIVNQPFSFYAWR
jgi:SAM-dependent methyltransferase